MATYSELQSELDNVDGLYGRSGAWRHLLSPQDVRAVDGYIHASSATTRYEQSPTGVWEPSTGSSGQVGYLDPNTNIFYPNLAESTGDAPQVPDVLVGVLRNAYNEALTGGPLTLPPRDPFLRTDEQQRGDAAEAIKTLESAMVLQQDDVADADLRLAEAVMSAHSTAESGNAQLNALQEKIDAYIDANPGLDTPAGAREFQRFLNGVLAEIGQVVLNGSLDAGSLRSVLTALLEKGTYVVPEHVPTEQTPPTGETPSEQTPTEEDPPNAPETLAAEDDSEATGPSVQQNSAGDTPSPAGQEPVSTPTEPTLDQLMGADSELLGESALPAQTAQQTPAASTMPSLGGLGGTPTGMSGSTPTSGTSPSLPTMPNLFGSGTSEPDSLSDLLSDEDLRPDAEKPEDEAAGDEEKPDGEESTDESTIVKLPNGDTVTAPNAEIASAISAAAGGTPVVDAYRQNGMTITPAGTPVESPVDTADIVTGDVGVFSDHHVIALGDSKALVSTSVQPVDDVVGPGFLGWERPPAPVASATSDTGSAPDAVTAPTRVAAAG